MVYCRREKNRRGDGMYLIPKWWEQEAKCADCGTTKSVKYWDVVKYPSVSKIEPRYCNMCMLIRASK